jgi:hypothetical protein
MRRREFVTLLGGAAAAWPLLTRAQQTDRMRRIGVLLPYPKGDAQIQARVQAFRQELARLGWVRGQQCSIRRALVHGKYGFGDSRCRDSGFGRVLRSVQRLFAESILLMFSHRKLV